jgi:hypothetical protein
MTKIEYLEGQRGKPYNQIISEQPVQTVQGSLMKAHYQELKTILGAGGLRLHLNTFVADTPEKMFALTAVNETFTEQYMADADFKVNFTVPAVLDAFNMVVSLGVIPQDKAQQLLDLAKYQKPEFDLTMRDVVAYFEPALLDVGEWLLTGVVNSNRLQLHTTAATPEPTMVLIQMSESEDGVNWTEYKRVNHFNNVHQPDFYFRDIPNNGLQRRLRVRGETYRLTGTVKAV